DRGAKPNGCHLDPLKRGSGAWAAELDADGASPKRPRHRTRCAAAEERIENELPLVRAGPNHALQVDLGNLVLVIAPSLPIIALNPPPIGAVPHVEWDALPGLSGRAGPWIVIDGSAIGGLQD